METLYKTLLLALYHASGPERKFFDVLTDPQPMAFGHRLEWKDRWVAMCQEIPLVEFPANARS